MCHTMNLVINGSMLGLIVYLSCLIDNVYCQAHRLYGEANKTINELNEKNFQQMVMSSNSSWTIVFFAEWCQESKQLEANFINASILLQAYMQFGAVDGDQNPTLREQFMVNDYPTILYFDGDKQKPPERFQMDHKQSTKEFLWRSSYPSGMTSSSSSLLMNLWRTMINEIYPGATSVQKETSTQTIDGEMYYYYKYLPQVIIPNIIIKQKHNQSKVIAQLVAHRDEHIPVRYFMSQKLTDHNFKETIFGSNHLWVVNFCHRNHSSCMNLLPVWNLASQQIDRENRESKSNQRFMMKFARVDCADQELTGQLAKRYRIETYPTVLIFDQRRRGQWSPRIIASTLMANNAIINISTMAITQQIDIDNVKRQQMTIMQIAQYVNQLLLEYHWKTI